MSKKKKLSKKERAELARQKAEESKQEKAEKKAEKKKKKKFRLNRVVGFLMAALGIAFLVLAGVFLYGKLFGPKPLAKILPAQRTVAYLELRNTQTQQYKLGQLFGGYPQFAVENLQEEWAKLTGIDLPGETEGWLGVKWGLAWLVPGQKTESFRKVIFLEARNRAAALTAMANLELAEEQELIEESYGNFTLYHYPATQGFSFTFLNRYLVMAERAETLQEVIDQYDLRIGLVRQDENYIEVANNLPSLEWGFAYANMQLLVEHVFQFSWITDELTQLELSLLKPLFGVFPAAGMSLALTDDALVAQNYLTIKKTALKDQKYFAFDKKYQGDLLNFLEADVLFFKGGHNLQKELKRMFEILKEVNPVTALATEAALRAKVAEFFGEEISLETDIYPLFEKEYLLAYDKDGEDRVWKLVLGLNDPMQNERALMRLKSKFVEMSALLSPVVKEVVLEDGTTGKELVANPEEIVEEEEEYGDYKIQSLEVTNQPWRLYYAFAVEKLFLANDLSSLKKSLDLLGGKVADEAGSVDYQKVVKSVMQAADEVMVWNVERWRALMADEEWRNYLEPFDYLSVGKNTFEDGISTIYYLGVK